MRCLLARKTNETACVDLAEFCTDPKNGREFDYEFNHQLDEQRIHCVVRTKRINEQGKEEDSGDVCEHYFTYEMDKEGHSHLVIDQNTCGTVSFALMGLGFFIATVLLGMVIAMVVKGYFVITDNRIMAEFNKHVEESKYEMDSPLYKSPITMYTLPEEYNMGEDGANRESFVVKDQSFSKQ